MFYPPVLNKIGGKYLEMQVISKNLQEMAHQFEKNFSTLTFYMLHVGIFLLADPIRLLKSLYSSAQGMLCLC